MKRVLILLEIVVRHTFSVCMTGGLLGAVYACVGLNYQQFASIITSPAPHFDLGKFTLSMLGLLCFGIIGAFLGGFFGALLGIPVGLVNGLLIAPLTILAYYPPAMHRNYRLVTGAISALAAIATTYTIFLSLSHRDTNFTIWAVLLSPIPIAGFGAWWANRFVARWYQHELPAQQAEEASPSSPTLL